MDKDTPKEYAVPAPCCHWHRHTIPPINSLHSSCKQVWVFALPLSLKSFFWVSLLKLSRSLISTLHLAQSHFIPLLLCYYWLCKQLFSILVDYSSNNLNKMFFLTAILSAISGRQGKSKDYSNTTKGNDKNGQLCRLGKRKFNYLSYDLVLKYHIKEEVICVA